MLGEAYTHPERQADSIWRRLRREILFILIFNGLFCAWILLKPCGPTLHKLVGNVAQAIGALLILPWCFCHCRKQSLQAASSEPVRPADKASTQWIPILLGLGVLCFAVGQSVWTYYTFIYGEEAPTPSWADASYLLEYPFVLAGILLLPAGSVSLAARTRIFLDSLIVLAALVTFSWRFLLGPIILNTEASPVLKIVNIAYPLADLIFIFCLLILPVHAIEARFRQTVNLLALGAGAYVITDTIYVYQVLQESYVNGTLLDVGWPLGYMLIGLGARDMQLKLAMQTTATLGETCQTTCNEIEQPSSLWRLLLPYLLVLAVGVLVVLTAYTHHYEKEDIGVYIGAGVIVGLVLLRQVVAILQNQQLYRWVQSANAALESQNQRLQATFWELEIKNRQMAEYAEQVKKFNEELTAMQAELLANNIALSKANTRLEVMAATDGMTGLVNHRAFQDLLRETTERVQQDGRPLSLLLLDVDHFKQYNDSFGHPAGDDVLRTVASLLRQEVRQGDFPARYGGEEFAVLLPNADAKAARQVAERIRAAIAAYPFAHRQVTVSVGVACAEGGETTPEALLEMADRALYAAKRCGRNRVMLAEDSAVNEDTTPLPQPVAASERENSAPPLDSLRQIWDFLQGLISEETWQALAGVLPLLQLRDEQMVTHSRRVARFALRLAQEVSRLNLKPLGPGIWQELAVGALLHDIGRIGVPDVILFKPGPLVEDEWQVMRQHPEQGAEVLKSFPQLACALPVVRCHHERWDGSGYPEGLAGEAIPLSARIFAIADTLEAMSSNRPYRRALPFAAIRDEIARLAGSHFDPSLVSAFLNVPKEEWEQLCAEETANIATASWPKAA